MEQESFSQLLTASAADLSILVPDPAIRHFYEYFCELQKWNKAINLTAILNSDEIVVKHFVDSMAGVKAMDLREGVELLDIGAGAGFPSIPLKLICSSMSVELLEPSKKRASFLRFLIGSIGITGATVVTSKLENYVEQRLSQRLFDYIVVRAFKVDSFGKSLESLLKKGGKVVLFRATRVEEDFRLDSLALVREVEYELPSGYGHRTLSVFGRPEG